MDIEELEILRKRVMQIRLHGILIIIALLILNTLCLVGFQMAICIPLYLLIIGVGVGIITLLEMNPQKEFSIAYKKKFIPEILKVTFDEYNYVPEKGISELMIKSTKMIHMGDGYRANDYIAAIYKGIQVIYSDFETYKRNDDGVYTIFEGKWMVFNLNQFFDIDIIIYQKGFSNPRIDKDLNIKKQKTGIAEFDKMFKVYTNENADISSVLTQSIMNILLNTAKKRKGKIVFGLIENQIHIGISNYKDSFEPSIYRKIDEKKTNIAFLEEIELMRNLIDEFVKLKKTHENK